MSRNDAIKTPDILRVIGKCVACDMSWVGIAEYIKEHHGVTASPGTVKKTYDRYKNMRGDIIAADKEIKHEIKEEVEGTIINTRASLDKIHRFVNGLMERSAGVDDKLALDCAREIRSQIELQEKMLHKMQAGLDSANINKLEITQIVVNKLDDLEKEGKIKIVEPALLGK